jgi:hypothetical protein
MRRFKRACVGVLVAAIFALAFGAGPAAADSLCKANENPCAKANRLPESVALARSEALKFCLTTCVEATVAWQESTSKDAGANAGLLGAIKAASFTGVKGECKKIEALNLPWATEWRASVQRLSFAGGGSGNPEIRLSGCLGLNVECQYSVGAGSLWAVTGGNPLRLHENEDSWSKTGGSSLCPVTGVWTSEGQMTEPLGLLHLVGSP